MKIGLIGNNISSSNAPDIHIRLAKIFEISLEYLVFDLKNPRNIERKTVNFLKKMNISSNIL